MASVNKVILMGNLGKDIELRRTPSGMSVCDLNVATSEAFVDKAGKKTITTEWHKVIVWGKMAENCAKYLAKGRSVFVEGKIQTKSWVDKNTQQKCYGTEIIASSVQFVGSGKSESDQKPVDQMSQQEAHDLNYGLDNVPF